MRPEHRSLQFAEPVIEADYAMGDQTFDLTISTEAMKVASLRSQVALAAVPWLEQVTAAFSKVVAAAPRLRTLAA